MEINEALSLINDSNDYKVIKKINLSDRQVFREKSQSENTILVAVIDTETTGFSIDNGDRIIDLSIAVCEFSIDQMDIIGHIIVGLMVIIDVYTNFLCILLSYSYFNSMYYKLCGCADKKCGKLCVRFAANKDVNYVAELVANTSSNSSKSRGINPTSPNSPSFASEISVKDIKVSVDV